MIKDAKFNSLEEFNKTYEGTGFLPPAAMKRYGTILRTKAEFLTN